MLSEPRAVPNNAEPRARSSPPRTRPRSSPSTLGPEKLSEDLNEDNYFDTTRVGTGNYGRD
ncbi:hypothetical protein U9M48_002140 [Paspalum notatum var. saurae]|uniref:Uncharacterized protein n=1 Tax=Paspalum notatum var. saurae TaxID=547442 RepID=A0AAQ3PJB2_PASNO